MVEMAAVKGMINSNKNNLGMLHNFGGLKSKRSYFKLFVKSSEVGKLAPIVVVMLPEALIMKRCWQYLNGKRGARF